MEKVRRGTDCGARREGAAASPDRCEPAPIENPIGKTNGSARVVKASGRFVLNAGRTWIAANSPHSLPESSLASGMLWEREWGGA